LGDDEFFTRHGITLRRGERGEAIDRSAQTVTSSAGETVAYDVLVLATGSYPFVPPLPHRDATGCFVYRTVEDILALEEYGAGSARWSPAARLGGAPPAAAPGGWGAVGRSGWRPPTRCGVWAWPPRWWTSRPA